jgi:hypothetical protein
MAGRRCASAGHAAVSDATVACRRARGDEASDAARGCQCRDRFDCRPHFNQTLRVPHSGDFGAMFWITTPGGATFSKTVWQAAQKKSSGPSPSMIGPFRPPAAMTIPQPSFLAYGSETGISQ